MRDHSPPGGSPVRGDEADLPTSITIRSDDLPDSPPRPAWARAERVEAVIDSQAFAEDDPEALRARGPVAVASALLLLARWGRHAPWRTVREAAVLLERWLSGDLRGEDLEAALGLRRRDGGPDLALQARRAERDVLLLGFARTAYPDLGPWAAAAAIREVISSYETRRWPRERHRPAAPADAVGAIAWRVLRLDLPQGPLPRQDDLARQIRQDREG